MPTAYRLLPTAAHRLDYPSRPPVGVHIVQRREGPYHRRKPADDRDLENKTNDTREYFTLEHKRQPGEKEGNYVAH